MAALSVGPGSALRWGCGRSGGGTVRQPGLPEINHQVREAITFCPGEIRLSRSPSLQAMSKHAGRSCFFSCFKNIQWTCVYNTAEGCDAEQQGAPLLGPAALSSPWPPPSQTTSTETLSHGLHLKSLARDVSQGCL